jgi:uncharacterized HAD superfamily protein
MHHLLRILYKYKRNKIYYLTARSYLSYEATYNWLTSMNLPVEKKNIVITRSATEKKRIIEKINLTGSHLYYIDDLSYLSKTKGIILYTDLISYFQNLNNSKKITYFGLKEIKRFLLLN